MKAINKERGERGNGTTPPLQDTTTKQKEKEGEKRKKGKKVSILLFFVWHAVGFAATQKCLFGIFLAPPSL